MTDYNYEIERTFAKYGGEADKGVERTCGNCISYDDRLMMCKHADGWSDASIQKPNESNCYRHRTNDEQKRLQTLIHSLIEKQEQRERQKRIEDKRRNGTGDCAGCPFREMRDMLKKVVNLDVLAGYWDVKNNCSLRESIEKLLAKTKEQR